VPQIKQVERIIRILQRLALCRELTVSTLYDFFERSVPKRTLQRDLIELSCADIPLFTKPGRGKELVWYLDSSYLKFVPMTVGSRELMASYFLERLSAVARGTQLEADTRSLLKKAKQFVAPDVFQLSDAVDPSKDLFGATFVGHIDYAPHSATIDLLIGAISDCKRCIFAYKRAHTEKVSEFEADPYLILYHKGALYTIVYVPSHNNFLFLPIQRIKGVSTTGASFKRRKDFSLDKVREGRFGIFGSEGLKPENVVLRFSSDIADVIAERIWHSSQKLTAHKDGSVTLTLKIIVSDELRAWVGSWLDYVTVVKPTNLLKERDRNQKRAAR
jgi:predicted DNA-binding transcriptional regulator YafY